MDIKLTIVCITYNQENYIKQALDGFINQKTNFPVEIIISDDCSSDKTPEIIEEYAKKYQNIKVIPRDKNLGVPWNFIDTLNLAKSKYVAVCEGDDYWIDTDKLQKQVDFLEQHPEYTACFHPVKVIWEGNKKKSSIYPAPKKMKGKKFITKDDMLEYNYIQTNSVVYRWQFRDRNLKDYFPEDILPADAYLHLLHAKKGNIAYLNDVMAVYRKQDGGIWYHNPMLKYGLKIAKCQIAIYENITERSKKFYNIKLLPTLKGIAEIYFQNGKIDELKALQEICKDYFMEAITFNPNKDKLKKYKKLLNIFIVISVILFILCIVFILK